MSAIEASGALAPDDEGLRALFSIVAKAPPHQRERPQWPFRTFNGNFRVVNSTPSSHENLVRVQNYLIKYKEALVAEHLLAP